MKLGLIANKRIISTFICCISFLLVLYCTLSQVNIDNKAHIEKERLKKIEKQVIDTNELLKKESNLNPLKFVNIASFGNVILEYSGVYNVSSNPLSVSKGALYFNGHKETYYSQRVLPGNSLAIPGRHVADDGTVRDADGFICVAADYSYLSYGSIVMTSLGPAKVYDTGCAAGTVDVYVDW